MQMRGDELILTRENYEGIKSANRKGNEVRWASDKTVWGADEKWEFPLDIKGTLREDCDGISLHKMRLLLGMGFPKECLLMIICKTETDEGHAILCVRTDRGDYFLDNRHSSVMTLEELRSIGYRFIYRSKGGLTARWEKIK